MSKETVYKVVAIDGSHEYVKGHCVEDAIESLKYIPVNEVASIWQKHELVYRFKATFSNSATSYFIANSFQDAIERIDRNLPGRTLISLTRTQLV